MSALPAAEKRPPTSPAATERTGFAYGDLDRETREFVEHKTAAIRMQAKRHVEAALAIGRDLTEVKERLGHGRFTAWLGAEFAWSERTAQNMMGAYERFKSETVADLATIDLGALYQLAAPSMPPEVVEAAKEVAVDGVRVTKAKVEDARAAVRETVTPAKAVAEAVIRAPKVAPELEGPEPEPEEEEDADLAKILEALTNAYPITLRYKTKGAVKQITNALADADPRELKKLENKAKQVARWFDWLAERVEALSFSASCK